MPESTQEEGAYPIRRAWYSLVVFQILLLAVNVEIAIVYLLSGPIESAFRIDDLGFASITATPLAIGVVLGSYPGGILADTFRRSHIIVFGTFLWTLAALIAAVSHSATLFFIARLLASIGSIVPGPAIFSILTDAFPQRWRAFAVGLQGSAAALGLGLGYALCGALVTAANENGPVSFGSFIALPWQQCFIAVALLGLAVSLLVLTVRDPPRTQRTQGADPDTVRTALLTFARYLKRHGRLWASLLLGSAASSANLAAIVTWGPTFGMRHFGATTASAAALFGTFATVGSFLGSLVGGAFAQAAVNYTNPRILPRSLTCLAVAVGLCAVSVPFMPSWFFSVAIVGCQYMLSGVVGIVIYVCIQEVATSEVRGQLFSLMVLLSPVASLGPILVPYLASSVFSQYGGLAPALATVGAIGAILAATLFVCSAGPYERARAPLRTAA